MESIESNPPTMISPQLPPRPLVKAQPDGLGKSASRQEPAIVAASQNAKVVFPKGDHQIGDFVNVLIERVTTTSLIGVVV